MMLKAAFYNLLMHVEMTPPSWCRNWTQGITENNRDSEYPLLDKWFELLLEITGANCLQNDFGVLLIMGFRLIGKMGKNPYKATGDRTVQDMKNANSEHVQGTKCYEASFFGSYVFKY